MPGHLAAGHRLLLRRPRPAARVASIRRRRDCYGSGIAPALGEAAGIHCPIQFHFGESDPYIPNEEVTAIQSAMTGRENAEVHVQAGAGHAFDNHEAAMFHNPDAAKAAWSLTAGFLERHLPTN